MYVCPEIKSNSIFLRGILPVHVPYKKIIGTYFKLESTLFRFQLSQNYHEPHKKNLTAMPLMILHLNVKLGGFTGIDLDLVNPEHDLQGWRTDFFSMLCEHWTWSYKCSV